MRPLPARGGSRPFLQKGRRSNMNSALAVGIGGSHVKIRIPSDPGKTPCDSGSAITPRQVVDGVPVHDEGRSR
jgi:hypothetical protein